MINFEESNTWFYHISEDYWLISSIKKLYTQLLPMLVLQNVFHGLNQTLLVLQSFLTLVVMESRLFTAV